MQQKQNTNAAKPANKDAAAEMKSNKKGTFGLILVIIILSLIITFGAIFVFNIGGIKQIVAQSMTGIPIIGKLMQPIAEDKTPEQIKKEAFALAQNDLSVKQQQLNEKQIELDKKDKELQAKEQELAAKEADLKSKEEALSTKITSVQEQVQYLEKIETSKAVQILLSMNEKDSVVQILRNMKKDKATQILSAMDPLQAAQLLEEISQPEASNNIKQ